MEGAEGQSSLQSTASSVAHELQLLGDPSGRQDSEYWDGWFDTVCRRQDHRSFEWYCSAGEVLRVVNQHCCYIGENTNLAMIHPGSGTSLVPLKLRDAFPASRQVVVDISSVAMDEVREVHDKQQQQQQQNVSCNGDAPPIEYVVTDLLQQKPCSNDVAHDAIFASSTFDCWIDKGFVDAIFSKKNYLDNRTQSAELFLESCRILKPHVGFSLIVSLAEDHSLQIIIESWLSHQSSWQRTLNVWELEPISGELPLFGFVLTKADETCRSKKENFKLRWHRLGNGDIEELSLCKDTALNAAQECAKTSRQRFTQTRQKVSAVSTERRVLVTLEIKPYDAEVDLVALSQRLLTEVWDVDSGDARRLLRPQWQPFSDHDPSELHRVVPICFGISKLLLKCIILSNDLEDLIELMEEWDDGVVQSVDVESQGTIPVGNICDLMR